MWISSEPLVFWLSIVVLWAGLASVILMRGAASDRRQTHWHCLFYLALVGLGLLTVLAAGAGNGAWMTSGTGLSVITVGATLDFGGAARRESTF